MTREQLSRAVADVTAALAPHCLADDVAEERARNLVQALAYSDATTREAQTAIVADILLTRCHEIREFWGAVRAAMKAYARVAGGDASVVEVAT